ncbi:SET domain containing protein [Brugia malayi]|uniref:[histone H3]-lysine(27) N-trimethyltransferase n=1 Tax=Brugia malayi TaxID=6279 RepID=A0A0J9Y002_BRUMA|nr:SET domain containing protein [Brugia malayi]CDP98787.1 BMA-MES-2, isoform b [Brugia malayi]VIO98663.1 SET domain containing protein [Brugia malayi]
MDTPNNSCNIGKRGIKNDGQVSRGAKRRCFKKDQLKEDVENEDSGEEKSFRGWKEDEDAPLPKYLRDDVTRIYEDVMSRYRNMIDAEGLKLYHKMLQEEPRKKYITVSRVKPLNLKPMPEQPTYFTLRSAMNTILQKCPSKCIEAVTSTPRMQYWTLTECNILCEDERTLSHIPFLGDHEDDDIGFGEELLKTFQEGIHGTKVGCGSFINDHILYQVLKKLFDKYSDVGIADQMIYRAVYEQFPNKASVQQLPFLFEDLKRRFGPSDLFIEDSNQSEFLDTKALHSFQLLLCSRCLTYDCLIHGVNATETEVRRRRGVTSVEPCGLQCFRHLTKEMEEAKRRCASPPDAKTINAILNIKTEDINWTAQQESMFIALRRTYKNDFCKLSEVLNLVVGNAPSKSCRELYAYSFRTAPISPRADVSPNSPPKKKKNMKDQHRTFRAVKWAKTEGKVGNTHVYEPCSHIGPCSAENNCSCVSVDNLCTKFCRCGEQCKYRFPGCRCAPGLCRTKQCQCFYANWECDPDVCKSCKCDILDDPNVATCKNVAMQRGLQKKLVIAPSQVAGWGCFAEEDIEKNDFISEYCGEVISHDESERRGKIYDKLKCSYLFGLNDEMVVDATRKGNVIRFANHSKDPNCMAKVFMVNGDHRIGIFARRPIVAGEELFFDYSYNSYQQVKFVSKERPKP